MEELNIIKQYPSENVINFLNRIEGSYTNILNFLFSESGLQAGKTDLVRDLALQRFIYHSTSEISGFLRSKNIDNWRDVLNSAIEEEKALQISKNTRKTPFPMHSEICEDSTHHSKQCYLLQKPVENPRPIASPIKVVTPNKTIVNIAKNQGTVFKTVIILAAIFQKIRTDESLINQTTSSPFNSSIQIP